MIVSHDSCTSLRACNPLWEMVSFAWRCQSRTIEEQVADGVGYFDLRVASDGAGGWNMAHGLVALRADLFEVLTAIGDSPFRLLLERGGENDEYRFRTLVTYLRVRYKLHEAVIKRGWRTVYHDSSLDMATTDESYVPFHSSRFSGKELWQFLKHPCWPKRWAKKHNKSVSEARRKSAEERVYMDFYEIGASVTDK